MKDSVLREKSKTFAMAVVRMYKFLREEKKESVMSEQVLRSGTSIGANNAEAISAISKADFRSKSFISLKEARLHGNYERGIGNYQENSLR